MTAPRSRPRRMTAAARRHQLLDVAQTLFSRKGFEATTTRDIAAAAKVTDALIYKHFASKEALLAEVVAQARERLRSLPVECLGETEPVGAVTGMIVCLAGFIRENLATVDLCWMEARRGGAESGPFEVLRGEVLVRVVQPIQEACDRGLLAMPDVALGARLLLGAAFALAVAHRGLDDATWNQELAQFARHTAGIFVDGTRACSRPDW